MSGPKTIIMAAFLAAVIGAQAQVTINVNNNADGETRTWTVTDLNENPPTVAGDNSPQISGVLEAAGQLDAAAQIEFTFTAAHDYTNSAAAAAITAGTFSNYVAGLTTSGNVLNGAVKAWGINSSANATDSDTTRINASEAVIIQVATSDLTTELILNDFSWYQAGSDDLVDILIYDASSNTVTVALENQPAGNFTGDYNIDNGDLIVIGSRNAGGFRFDKITFNIASTATGVIPPAALTATPANSLITLNWLPDTSGTLDYFEVHRSTDGGTNYTLLGTATTNLYTDFVVTNGFTYYYKAKAVDNTAFKTDFSDPASATPFIPVPTGLSAAAGNQEVVLDWDDSTDYLFSSFNVWRSTMAGTNYAVIATDVLSSTYTDTNVVNETKYYYVVSQVDVNGGESALSSETDARPTPALIILNPNNADIGLVRVPTNGATYATNSVDAGVQTSNLRAGQYSTSIPTLARCIIQFDLTQQDIIDAGKTTNDIERVLLRVNAYNNNLLSPEDASGDGSAVEVYASQTKAIDTIVKGDFDNPAFDNFIGTIPGLTNGNGIGNFNWFEIDVTDAVLADLANDSGSFGSAFRLQLNNDVFLTNANYAAENNLTNRSYVGFVQFVDNYTAGDWPQLRIEFADSRSGYVQWTEQWAPADVSVQTNDYDEDGLDNLNEYALDGNPTNALDQGTLPTFTKVGGAFEYVHPQRSDDTNLVYTVETKTDLAFGTWTNLGYVVSGTNLTGETLNIVTNTVDTIEDQRFIRLQVEYSE